MIVITRDEAWSERLRRLAARGGWPFAASETAPVPGSATREHILIVLDRAAAEGALARSVAVLRGLSPAARIVVAFSDGELDSEGAAAGVASGADEVLVKSWSDDRLYARLAAARDAGLAAAVRISADEGLKAEQRSRRVFARVRGRWKELPVASAEFALLWLLMSNENSAVSRDGLLDALIESAGRDVEIETVSRRMLSLRKSLAPWKGKIETVRGGFYRLVSSRLRSKT
jgi:DNA-binding response OmpR family regulator